MTDQDLDRSIGGSGLPADESVDLSPTVTPEDFDFASWLAGARPVRRAVRITPRGDLVAVMERAVAEYEAGDDAALERYAEAKKEFEAAARWFVLEALSGDARQRIREEVIAGSGMTAEDLAAKTDDPDEAARRGKIREAIVLSQLAAHIVTPAGVTAKDIVALYEVAPLEVDRLVVTMHAADSQAATATEVGSPDFSPRR